MKPRGQGEVTPQAAVAQKCHDIREWLRNNLIDEIAILKEKEANGRGGKASIERLAKINSKSIKLARLDEIRSFSYSPSGENQETNALNHSEFIAISAEFLSTKPLMQWILVGRFPILLVDESQDTNKRLVDAFFSTAQAHKPRFSLGLIWDVMQRIYADGKDKIEQHLPPSWAKPTNKLNHRCPRRVVHLINQIRSAADHQTQEPRSDTIEDTVRLFIRPIDAQNRQGVEHNVRERMADITADDQWRSRDACKILTLEHYMAAKRLGFDALLQPLLAIDNWRTGLLDGSLPATRFFAQDVFPLFEAALRNDKFTIARIAREKSPLLSPQSLKDAPDAGDQLRKAQAAVSALVSLWDNQGKPTIGEVLDTVAMGGFFTIPDILKPVVSLRIKNHKMAVVTESLTSDLVAEFDQLDLSLRTDPPNEPIATNSEQDDPISEQTDALLKFLEAPFSQVESYKSSVSGQAPFDTHQGVKGLEFDRVMVIMDDEEARGFMFSYDKLFGAKAPSETDQKNEASGKETGLDRTRRLLYVTCSRAEKGLALVAYTDNPIAKKAHALANGWFNDDEVDI